MALPDVVGLVRTYLADQLANAGPGVGGSAIPVQTRVDRDRPAEWVQVRRVGGSTTTVRDLARLDVIAWAETEPRATELGQLARAAMWRLAGSSELGPPVYRVAEFMGPRQLDDGDTGTPQLWITFDLSIRADELIHLTPNP